MAPLSCIAGYVGCVRAGSDQASPGYPPAGAGGYWASPAYSTCTHNIN